MRLIKLCCIAAISMMGFMACGNDEPEPAVTTPGGNNGSTTDPGDETPTVEKTPTLLITDGWVSDTIAPGLIYHNFEQQYDDVTKGKQIVNVLELDMTDPSYTLELRYILGNSSCSDAVKGSDGIAGINGGYETEAIYIKVNNYRAHEVTLAPDHLRFWKHEGAVYWSTLNDLGFTFAGKNGADAIAAYKADKHRNLIASAPMLIENYDPCGTRFVDPSLTAEDLNRLNYEDSQRHQGVRHPRTAIAVTEDRDLLLVTVDGRWPGRGEGMNARELTEFLVKYFNPQDALNMDGGGSTTMVVKGHGDTGTNVVNYPTDNGVFDHTGERKVSTHFIIKKK
ncbi:MAG: phosphodiester glycosidase family protein [Muribaculaceae bacterium]|nr:phosphodiester glycosidase family protein [Muribaculaceae bacterium]